MKGMGKWTPNNAALGSTLVDDGPLYLPVPYAQQIFSLVPAAAGVIAGLLLAQRFAATEATEVKASEVLIASGLSFTASLAVVFMIRTFKAPSVVREVVEETEEEEEG